MPISTASSELYIGLMSGTSMDAIDGVLADFGQSTPRILSTYSSPIAASLHRELAALATPGENELQRMGSCDHLLGHAFAEAAIALANQAGVPRHEIAAIGSHGQTIRHHPAGPAPFTLQIGNASIIAQQTGITTVADFRTRDIAAGGQGAPLVPAFHSAMFRTTTCSRCIVNIGGIANITLLPADGTRKVTGFDTGPGNLLMDGWIYTHLGHRYDHDGQWAATGSIREEFLDLLMKDEFITAPPPKSTGRERFNPAWINDRLKDFLAGSHNPLPAADIQATLCELTVRSIVQAIKHNGPDSAEILVCGGGSHNAHLMSRLALQLTPARVDTTDPYGVSPDWVEAMAFAWLARQTMKGLPGNLPEVTGAQGPVVLGAIHPG